jgi:hypothetical protein
MRQQVPGRPSVPSAKPTVEYMQEIGVGLRLRVVQRGPSQSLLRYEPPAPGFPAETVIANEYLQPWKEEAK